MTRSGCEGVNAALGSEPKTGAALRIRLELNPTATVAPTKVTEPLMLGLDHAKQGTVGLHTIGLHTVGLHDILDMAANPRRRYWILV